MNIKTQILKEPKNSYKISVVIDKTDVAKYFDNAIAHEAENAEIKGFRKGKAPLSVVKENLDPAKLRSHALNHLLSDTYLQVVKENHLAPIVDPKFYLKTFEEGQDAEFEMTIVEKPEIKLNNYKDRLGDYGRAKAKVEEKPISEIEVTNQNIVDILVESGEIEIADPLIEEEVNRMMSSLIDQTAKLGITVDQYLQSINKTPDELRSQYRESAETTIKSDFLITQVSLEENITIGDEEVDTTIAAVPDEKSREILQKPEQRMYIKAVLIKGKTLDYLRDITKNAGQTDTSKTTNAPKKESKGTEAVKEQIKTKTTKKGNDAKSAT